MKGRTRVVGFVAVGFICAGTGAFAYGLTRPAGVVAPTPALESAPSATRPTVPVVLSSQERSAPVTIRIPAIGVSSVLGPSRGLNPNGTVSDAPLSGPTWSLPWWYNRGSAPGQAGSAVILGHVDSAIGAGHLGVFFRLGDLKPGDTIQVSSKGGISTTWTVTSNVVYSDKSFPDAVVYAHSGPPTLRLVTCGGTFNYVTHGYESAVVVTAVLASST